MPADAGRDSASVDLTEYLDRLWVIADTHFGHDNIVRLAHRPFAPDEQDEVMLGRWREVVGPDDPILHLGDVAVASRQGIWSLIHGLPGRPKWLVRGNHDRDHRMPSILAAGFTVIRPPSFLYRGWLVECTHQPIPARDLAARGRILNVHGHVHDNVEQAPDRRHVNVCVERTDYRPVRLERLLDERLAALDTTV